MKNILIIVAVASKKPDNMNWLPLRDALRTELGDGNSLEMTSLTSLIFDISNEECHIIDSRIGRDVAEYDFVVIRNVGKTLDLGITLAHYLRSKNVPFTDSYLEMRGAGKLACAMLRRREGLSTPRTVYASAKNLANYLTEKAPFSYPLILKADDGKKGRDNYLISDRSELENTLRENAEVRFIAQEFIPNDGDYRALVMGSTISLVIKRTSSGDSHLTNTSQGGSAELVDVSIFDESVQRDILAAAKVEALEVAGVDIVFNKNTNEHFFLEVNRAPQIGTGAFADKKIAAYAQMIKERANQ